MTKNDIRRWLQWSTDPTDAGLRGSAACVLGPFASVLPEAFETLLRLSKDEHWCVRLQTVAAIYDLARSTIPSVNRTIARERLEALTKDDHEYVHLCAASYLQKYHRVQSLQGL
jgi:hypothetical protein